VVVAVAIRLLLLAQLPEQAVQAAQLLAAT
jgi:hypothetical protein